MKILKTDFDPIINGYKFINRFDLKQLIPFFKLKKHFFLGLCGGMVYSVLDYFYSKSDIPDFSDVEALPKSFVDYLWVRQTNSVSIKTLAKLIFKSISSDKKIISDTIKNEIPLIIDQITLKFPVPVVIIRNDFFKNPTDNHQVLIVSVEIDGPVTIFECYDPNHPLLVPIISIDRTSGNERISQSTGEVLRGLFVNNFKQKSPYLP